MYLNFSNSFSDKIRAPFAPLPVNLPSHPCSHLNSTHINDLEKTKSRCLDLQEGYEKVINNCQNLNDDIKINKILQYLEDDISSLRTCLLKIDFGISIITIGADL
ncbi:3072_t:CDS:2 [Diversispora eburnea]|uniref:3072_t:CDS:1 n=1 Tax=Diversispora eburnea TaxID=1213867 RepID=A0A9N8ZS44_9GLOM|nr:3072_t:CDS:2 [Diversispora eburnea]